ncbi:MAG: hypothetical protein ACYDDS_13155 [Candidatus Sulfotelmatobacter sp.]|jgi:hypothetical protein
MPSNIEIKAVLRNRMVVEAVAAALLTDFGIDKQQIVAEAYVDLLAR